MSAANEEIVAGIAISDVATPQLNHEGHEAHEGKVMEVSS